MALKKRGRIYHMIFQIDGVIVRESTRTADKREAERIEAKRKGELFSEVIIKGRKPIKCEKALELFRRSRRGMASEESLEVKTRPFQGFAGRDIHDIKPNEVIEALREVQQSTTCVTKNGVVRKKGNSLNTANVSVTGPGDSTKGKLLCGACPVRLRTNEKAPNEGRLRSQPGEAPSVSGWPRCS
jgi:hypothetical protein